MRLVLAGAASSAWGCPWPVPPRPWPTARAIAFSCVSFPSLRRRSYTREAACPASRGIKPLTCAQDLLRPRRPCAMASKSRDELHQRLAGRASALERLDALARRGHLAEQVFAMSPCRLDRSAALAPRSATCGELLTTSWTPVVFLGRALQRVCRGCHVGPVHFQGNAYERCQRSRWWKSGEETLDSAPAFRYSWKRAGPHLRGIAGRPGDSRPGVAEAHT